MAEWEVFPYAAAAVGMKAIEQGVARLQFTHDELYRMAEKTIGEARSSVELLMKEGFIPMP